MPLESIGLCSSPPSARFNNQILSTANPTALVYLMRITALPERIGEGEDQYDLRPPVLKGLERIKWYLWHGNVFQALNELHSLENESGRSK
jgi:hypothetical protein